MRYRFCVGRALGGLLRGQREIRDGLLSVPAPTVMMSQLTVVLLQTIRKELFNRVRGLFVQPITLLNQHRVVRDLLREGVLENIPDLGKGGLLIEKFLALQ